MQGADTLKIIEQVNRCPTGALSYVRNEAGNPEYPEAGEQLATGQAT